MHKKNASFTSDDLKIISKSSLYNGFFKMVQYDFTHKLFAGGWSETVSREIFERGHAVAVLPYDPKREEFVLIEQVRIGALATSDSPWLLEVIAGIIDEGETTEEVCLREAKEEAGISLTHLSPATSYLASPGGTTERIHVYVAKTDATLATGIHGLDHEAEDIKVHRVSETDAFSWLENGRIDNAATIIALQWFFIHKQQLLKDWELV